MRTLRITLIAALVVAAAVATAAPARAGPGQVLSFVGCTSNSATNVQTGQAQLFVEVSDAGAGLVNFHFTNIGPLASSIADVYFQDGTLLAIASITNGPGVDFSQLASPPDLPGGNECTPPFQVTQGFSADSNPPVQPNGVNPGEYLDITFSLQNGQTYADTINSLQSGALRIGIHVQGFANGGSESFVNDGFTAVRLASFGATTARGRVTLSWATGAEIGNAGFNLYRSTSLAGSRVRVNNLLVAARGSEASGNSYSLVDVPGYGPFYYWLEDVDVSGLTTLHGPVQVAVRSAVQRPAYRPALPGGTR